MKNRHFLAAMYLRLSRDDRDVGDVTDKNGSVKLVSNSIINQRELIKAFIHEQVDTELYDIYVDDGFSGSNFDRPEFKRMMMDIEAGRVNMVIVKDLSRFGRDYIEAGRYIQKVFPALGVRFVALTDHYDSLNADIGQSGIILPVKNFINDSYCRDISAKVKSQFEIKRKNGECIAPFAPYGYRKGEGNKKQLVTDEYAAEIVRRIFQWKIEGMAVSAIADKLNGLGVLSPKEYKRFIGSNYNGGFIGAGKSMWSSSTVKRILTNEMYTGHLVQGKTEKVSYKLKKSIEKPREAWVKVENTHEPVISEDSFLVVQNLLRADSRVSMADKKTSLFAGLLFCGDCGEQMIRRVNRYKSTERVYYICSTKNRSEGCTRHSIEEERLKELVSEPIRRYADTFFDEGRMYERAFRLRTNVRPIACCDNELARLKREQAKYASLCMGLSDDLERGIITQKEYGRLYSEFKCKSTELCQAQKKQETMLKELKENSVIADRRLRLFRSSAELREMDRHMLCGMVRGIKVFENKRLEIEFYYRDKYHMKDR